MGLWKRFEEFILRYEDHCEARVPFQKVKYDFEDKETGQAVFKFESIADARWFAFRSWFHGMTFDRSKEIEERPGRASKVWTVLTVRSLPNVSCGGGRKR